MSVAGSLAQCGREFLQWVFLQRLVGKSRDATGQASIWKVYVTPFLVWGLLSFGSIYGTVLGSIAFSPRHAPLAEAHWGWLTTWQFLILFPSLVIVVVTERRAVSRMICRLADNGVICLDDDGLSDLTDRGTKRYTKWDMVGWLLGLPVGAVVIWVNRKDQLESFHLMERPAWYVDQFGITYPGTVWLMWLGVFWLVLTLFVVKSLASVAFFSHMCRSIDLHLQLFHSDNSNGFAPVGRIGLRYGCIVAVAGVAIVVLLTTSHMYESLTDTKMCIFGGSCLVYLVFGPIAFFGPLIPFRNAMSKEKRKLEERASVPLRKLIIKINEAGSNVTMADMEMLKERRQLREIARRTPVWPFDAQTWRQFLAGYLIPVLGAFLSLLLESARTLFGTAVG